MAVSLISGQGIVLLGHIILVPQFLRAWGVEGYGTWILLSALVAYLGTLDFGLNMYATNKMSQAWAIGDYGKFRQMQTTCLVFYSVVGATIIAAAVMVSLLPYSRDFLSGISGSVILTTSILATQVVVSIPAGLIVNTYRTLGKPWVSSWVGNWLRLATITSTAITLALEGKMEQVAGTQLILNLLVPAAILVHLRFAVPQAFPRISHFRISVLKESINPSFHFGLITIGTAAVVQSATILVASTLGTLVLAQFQVARTLANVQRQAFAILNGTLWPELTVWDAQAERRKFRAASRLHILTSATCAVIGAVILHTIGSQLIALWTKGQITVDQPLLDAAILYVALQAPWMAASVTLAATNNHDDFARRSVLSGLLGLIAGYMLSVHLGAAGVFIGFTLSEGLLYQHWTLKSACQLADDQYKEFATKLWGGVPVVAVGTWAGANLAPALLQTNGVLSWAVVAVGATVAGLLTSYVMWFTGPDRDSVQTWLRLNTIRTV